MKYMGSKRYMLENGLGELLQEQLVIAKRIVDPFCGAGSVINFAAKHSKKRIIAGDLQKYCVVLAKAVIERTKPLDADKLTSVWLVKAKRRIARSRLHAKAVEIEAQYSTNLKQLVIQSRELCAAKSRIGPVWNAYGGHYFSPKQAITLDYLRKCLPRSSPERNVCLAAIIIAASRCAAAPGHTAQPFQPTPTAGKFLKAAWNRSVVSACETALNEIAPLHAKTKGTATVIDAKKLASSLRKGDLVVVDPPYSGVQYSRFYHVLETIARGRCGKVEGTGRYPLISKRPQSEFSNVGQSLDALRTLLKVLSKRRATVILTFPKGECSNGLTGDIVLEEAKYFFNIGNKSRIHQHAIKGKFSTLGGNNKLNDNNRVKKSRVLSRELLLILKPKRKKRIPSATNVQPRTKMSSS